MRVLVLGGDGYLGWPTVMHLSSLGYDVLAVDNYLRRRLSRDHDVEPLFQVPNLHERVRIWQKKSGCLVQVQIGDLQQYSFMEQIVRDFAPEAIIHYAEQPSAPYSMLNQEAAQLTVQNNLGVTLNLIYAVKQWAPACHIIKLGTMGEYGTPNIDIEEGWIDIEHKNRKDRFLFPRQAGSLYHTTKIMDTDLLWFYVRMWQLRVTDLMQGPVYGLFTHESGDVAHLWPFFNYDEIFGTVVNRFVVQAVAGFPLTVYGKGGQTRGYLNLMDTLNCVRLALENPVPAGELRIFNQLTETFSVNELADKVQRVGQQLGLQVTIQSLENPRLELEEHYYNPVHSGLLELGLQPNYLTDDVLGQMIEAVIVHQEAIQEQRIFRRHAWK